MNHCREDRGPRLCCPPPESSSALFDIRHCGGSALLSRMFTSFAKARSCLLLFTERHGHPHLALIATSQPRPTASLVCLLAAPSSSCPVIPVPRWTDRSQCPRAEGSEGPCRHWWERLQFDRRHLATGAGDPGDDSPTGCGAAPVLLTPAFAVTTASSGRLRRVPTTINISQWGGRSRGRREREMRTNLGNLG